MIGYRYEVVKDSKRQGFMVAFDDYFSDNEIFNLCFFFEDELDLPPIDMKNTKSYFTKKGNRKFHKAIVACRKAYESKGIRFELIEDELDESTIVFQDKNQIICKIV